MKKNIGLTCSRIMLSLTLLGISCLTVLLLIGPVVGPLQPDVSYVPNIDLPPKPAPDGPIGRYPVPSIPAPYPTHERKPVSSAGSGSLNSFLSGSNGCLGFINSSYSSECSLASSTRQSRPTPVPQRNETLRAGEIDDNADWTDYLRYRQTNPELTPYNLDVSERYIIAVTDKENQPGPNATVRIFDPSSATPHLLQTTHTVANGQTLFHPLALGLPDNQPRLFQVEIEQGDSRQTFSLTRSTQLTWPIRLATGRSPGTTKLDVLFLIDATGSMADEIDKIQRTIFEVTDRIDHLSGQASIRYGLVAYRDRGESFVTKTYDFTPEVVTFSANLNTIKAHAGGDYPEALNAGLHQALHHVSWRTDDTVRLIFLVADAPPHLDYVENFHYADDMVYAVQRGIKIFTIASSGLDDQGEYIFRQLAQYTQGRFIFLAYDAAGSGSSTPVAGQIDQPYSVANLDDLLVNLVRSELHQQNPGLTEPPATRPAIRNMALSIDDLLDGHFGRWLWPVLLSLLAGFWVIWAVACWTIISKWFRTEKASSGTWSPTPNRSTLTPTIRLKDPKLQDYVDQARDYNAQIKSLLGQNGRAAHLAGKIEAWDQAINQLARQIDQFQGNAVINQDLEMVPRAIMALETQLAFEPDPVLLPELKRTLAKRQQQQGLLTTLTRTMRQAELQLEHTLSALGAIYSQLVSGPSAHQVADNHLLLQELDEEVQRLQDYLEAIQEVKQPV